MPLQYTVGMVTLMLTHLGGVMKILNKKEFLDQGVCLFCRGPTFLFGGLCLKGKTLYDNDGQAIDFYYTDLCIIESLNSEQLSDRLEEMVNTGKSHDINMCESRDGCFDDSEIFLVYEPNDVHLLFTTIRSLGRQLTQ